MISFTLAIDPIAKGRPRLGPYGTVYTPINTRRFENDVRIIANPYKPVKPILGAIRVNVKIMLKPPVRRVRDLPTCRPDWDNFAKSICDALNGMFWKDDSQIVDCRVSKRYDWVNRRGRIEIQIFEEFEMTELDTRDETISHLKEKLAELEKENAELKAKLLPSMNVCEPPAPDVNAGEI